MWVLGTKPGSSRRAASPLNLRDISPVRDAQFDLLLSAQLHRLPLHLGLSPSVWASGMGQQVKAPAAKLDDLTLIPSAHMVEGEN